MREIKTVTVVVSLIATSVMAVLYLNGRPQKQETPQVYRVSHEKRTETEEERIRKFVVEWLESQKRGEDGLGYWLDARTFGGDGNIYLFGHNFGEVKPIQFYSLRSYEILKVRGGMVDVRVDSSNSHGIPITVTWIIMTNGFLPKNHPHGPPLPLRLLWVCEK